MKKIFMMLFCLMMAIGTYAQREYQEITKEQLPKNVIEFVDTYYSDSIYKDYKCFVEFEYQFRPSTLIDEYEVHFDNGTKLEFNRRGNLTSIECGINDKINVNILPVIIKDQLKKYSNRKIVELSIDYNRRGKKPLEYEIDFDNGFECKFNSKGKVIID